jgi:hypothetical protein
MKYLNPIVFITKLINLIKELFIFRKYLSIISELEKNGELEKIGLRRTRLGRLYYVKNLQPEVLLNTDDLKGFEIMQVKESLADYNDPMTRLGIIDFLKTGFRRIKTTEVYGYLVWMDFDFKQVNLERILYVIIYPVILTLLIVYLAVPGLGHIDWSHVWQSLNSK